MSETTSGREPFIAVAIDQDFCRLIYGQTNVNLLTYTNTFQNGGWDPGHAGMFTVVRNDRIAPDNTLSGVKFTSTSQTTVLNQSLFLRAYQSKPAGTYRVSLYVYVPTQSGVTNWSLLIDAADSADTAQTAVSTVFDAWVRASATITYTATRAHLDFNIRYNTGQTVLYAGFVLWAWGAQLETGTTTSDYYSNNKSFQCNAATPSNKCFNTLATCQDINNYDKGEGTLYFCKPASNIPKDNPYIPSVASVSTAPTKINPTNQDRNSSPLGQRAAATIVFDDHPHSDFRVDPYLSDRNYDPLQRGTFWSKWVARNPYYQNRPLRIYEGYLDENLSNAQVRSYFIDSIQGPDSNGRVQIVAKDPLKLADRQKAQVPAPSTGTLRIAINTTDTTIDIGLAVLADYPAPGIVRIDDELITYTTSAIVTISSVDYVRLTGVTRATNGSIADDHDAGTLVQICTEYDDEPIWDVVYDLLTTYAGIDASFIPYSDWQSEGTVWLAQFNVSAILSQPKGVGEVLGEILQQVLLYIWWDERDQEIKLRAIRPLIGTAPTFTDDANIIENTVSLTTDPKNRVSQIWVYWDQNNKAEDVEKESNYKKLRIRADLEAESAEKYGESRVRKIYARWIQNDAQAINLSARLLGASFENPKILKLRVDAKDRAVWTADVVDILHRNIVDFTGSPTLERYQVLSVEEVLPGEVVQYEMQRFIFKGTRFGFYMASDAPTFAAATQEQKDGNAAWYSDADGLMSDGSSGWEYQ